MAQDQTPDIRQHALDMLTRYMPSTDARDVIGRALAEMLTPEEIRRESEYNGWPNRETWATALHIDNDQGLYTESRTLVRRMRYSADYAVSDSLKDWFEEQTSPDSELWEGSGDTWVERVWPMYSDIGSLWRVDWEEIARNFLSDVDRGCWHVGHNLAGYMPESDVQCFVSRADAISALHSEMEEYADENDEGYDALAPDVPADFPVQPLLHWSSTDPRVMQCGECGRAWDDTVSTDLTPAPSGRCPFEYFHSDLGSMRATVDSMLADADTDRTPRGEHDGEGYVVSDNDDRSISFWAQYVPFGDCDHSECEHDDDDLETEE